MVKDNELSDLFTNLNISDDYIKHIINIQKVWRSYKIRKSLKNINDGMTSELLLKCINSYKITHKSEIKINNLLNKKKIRMSNFPSHISENIVKFAFYKKYKVMPSWDTKSGDLIVDNPYCKKIQIEVKGFLRKDSGPISFGPKEKWNRIYFVDASKMLNNIFKVYEFKLSDTNIQWQNLMVNSKETYKDHCEQKRRPRILFKKLCKQLENNYSIIFNGNISGLDVIHNTD